MVKVRLEGPAGEAGELFGLLRQMKGWIMPEAGFKPEQAENEGDVVVALTMDVNRDACMATPEQAKAAGVAVTNE